MAKQDTNNNYKAKRGLGGAVTRQRRRAADGVRADKDALWASNKRDAKQELERNRREFESRAEKLRQRFINHLFNSTINTSIAVTRSRGLYTVIKANVAHAYHSFSAYTDFSAIYIQWPETMLPKSDINAYEVLDAIAQIRGVYFHEEGHIRYTLPYPQIVEAVTADYWAKHNKAPDFEFQDFQLTRTWNALEDQRMECAVVADVPRMATYFTPMALNILLQQGTGEQVGVRARDGASDLRKAYVLVAGRTYLPANIRQECADIFDEMCDGYHVPNGAATWFDIVSRYKAAVTTDELYAVIVEAHKFLISINGDDNYDNGGQTHRQQYRNPHTKPERGATETSPEDAPIKADPPIKADKPESGEGEGDGSGSGDDEGEGEGEGEGSAPAPHKDDYGDDSNKPTEDRTGEEREAPTNPVDGSQTNHGDGSHVFNKDALTKIIEEAVDSANTSLRGDTDVLGIFENLGDYDSGSSLPDYDGQSVDMSPAELDHANNIAVGIQNALETYVSASSPQWKTHQERGVIQPLQYRTKEIGSQEFHRRLDGNGNTGLDLHVSILADASGSMYGNMLELSQFMYAARTACDALNIGTTLTLWSSDHQNYRIWNSGIKSEVFPAMGGTEPTRSLDDLATHNPENASNHLVLIFTDGEWGNEFPSLARWSTPGRSIMFIRYGYGEDKSMGADTSITISNINELGEQLTYGISDVLASSSH